MPCIFLKRTMDLDTLKQFYRDLEDRKRLRDSQDIKLLLQTLKTVILRREPRRARRSAMLDRVANPGTMGSMGWHLHSYVKNLILT